MGCHSSRGRAAKVARSGGAPERKDAGKEPETAGFTEVEAESSTAAPPSADSSGAAGDGEVCVATLRLRIRGLSANLLTEHYKSSLAVSLVVEISEILGIAPSAIAHPSGICASARVAVRSPGQKAALGGPGPSIVATLVLTLGGGRTPASLAETMGQESVSIRLAKAVEAAMPAELRGELEFEVFVSAGAPAPPKAKAPEAGGADEDQGKMENMKCMMQDFGESDSRLQGSSEALSSGEDVSGYPIGPPVDAGCGATPVNCGSAGQPNFLFGSWGLNMCVTDRMGSSENAVISATNAVAVSPRPAEGEVRPTDAATLALDELAISESSRTGLSAPARKSKRSGQSYGRSHDYRDNANMSRGRSKTATLNEETERLMKGSRRT